MDTMTSPVLTAADRCDRCAAQAYVAYEIAGMALMFCAHHNRDHGPALLAKGATVTIDNTGVLS
jgi:hypothetical protein